MHQFQYTFSLETLNALVLKKIQPRMIDQEDELFRSIESAFYPQTHYRHLGRGTGGRVFGVTYQGQEVAIKMCRKDKKSAWKETSHEARMYHHLKSLQGTILLTVVDFVEWRQIDHKYQHGVPDNPEHQQENGVRHRAIVFKEVGESLSHITAVKDYDKNSGTIDDFTKLCI